MSVSNLLHSVEHLHPEFGNVGTQTIARELSGTLTFDVEFRASRLDSWTVKVHGFDTAEEAWEHLDRLAAKPIYTGCLWQVVETHRLPVRDTRGDERAR